MIDFKLKGCERMIDVSIISIGIDVITCFGVIIALFSFILTRKATLAEYERAKKLSTVEILKEYESKFHKYNRFIYKNYKYSTLNYSEIISDKKLEKIVWDYLNDLEFICTGINIGIYDINTLERVFGDVLVRVFYQFFPYIKERRKQRSSNIVYAELERVVKEIEKIQQKNMDLLNREADIKYKL